MTGEIDPIPKEDIDSQANSLRQYRLIVLKLCKNCYTWVLEMKAT